MSLRHAARALADRAAALTGLLGARERAMRGGLTVLTYHRVLPDDRATGYHLPSLAMPLSPFREQVRHLSERFRVVTVREGVELLERGPGDGPAAVSLTFDDGYADNFAVAAPVLADFGVRATFYVTTGLIGTNGRLWFDEAALAWARLGWESVVAAVTRATGRAPGDGTGAPSIGNWMAFLKSLGPQERRQALDALGSGATAAQDALDRLMTPAELAGLVRRGHEIGSHSVTHPLLPQLTDSDLDGEVTRSREQVSSWTGIPPQGFCYPNGDHDERVVAATRRAGYSYACSTAPGRNAPAQDRFRMLRVDMNPRRVTRAGAHDELAVRGEVSLLHGALR